MAPTSIDRVSPAAIDLTDDAQLAPPPVPSMLPIGRQGQLHALEQQLRWCDHAVAVAQRQAATAMRREDVEESQRWEAVRRLRTLSWKVCREVLPLVSRVPLGLRAHPQFREVERAAHELRRRTEDALRDNANYTVDLVSAASDPLPGRRG